MESKYDCKKTSVNIFDQWGYKVGSREWGRWIYGERGIGEGLDKIAEPRINEGVVVPVWRGVWRGRQ